MPTPFEQEEAHPPASSISTWSAATAASRRSVFANYRSAADPECPGAAASGPGLAHTPGSGQTLQSSIDIALARSFLHQFLARAWQDPGLASTGVELGTSSLAVFASMPLSSKGGKGGGEEAIRSTPETWRWLTNGETLDILRTAVASVSSCLLPLAQALIGRLVTDSFDCFHLAYLSAFGHAARGPHALNEIEYGDLKADPLFQPHRLADLAAFYRAFGMEVAPDAGERHDHLCLELEFLCFLAAREAYALEHQLESEDLALCFDAQKKFLREHLGRWVPACMRRLARDFPPGVLQSLAQFTRAFIESECARFGVPAGSEDLLLRPVDSSAESLCASCGLSSLPPGALAGTGTATGT